MRPLVLAMVLLLLLADAAAAAVDEKGLVAATLVHAAKAEDCRLWLLIN